MMAKGVSNELVKGSFTLFIFMNLFNVFNYFFHFISARLLGPVEYGVLAVIMSMVFVFAIPADSIQVIISRYSTKYNLKNKGIIKGLMGKAFKKFTLVGIVALIVFLAISPLISKFLSIDLRLIMLSGLILFSFFIIPITKGVMQGTKRFFSLGLASIFESFIKLCFAALFILLGWGVLGAVFGVLVGFFVSLLFSLLFLKDILKEKTIKNEEFGGIYSYSFPVLVSIIAITLFYSFDVIIAKRFFADEIVGQYAVISLIGKMLFFGTIPISRAMFPLISEKHDENKKLEGWNMLVKTFLIVLALDIIILICFAIFPDLIINILYGKGYLGLSSYLVYMGIAMSFLSFTNIALFYNLSTHRYKISFVILFFSVLQILLLMLFSKTIGQFILTFVIINFITFIASLFSLRIR